MARFERLLDRYEPVAVVFEEFETGLGRRGTRSQHLCRAMIHLAAGRGADTPVYGRDAIALCFRSIGAVTRYEIAQAIAQHIDVFRKRLPPPRKIGSSEDRRQGLFDAIAVALTHFAFNGRNARPGSAP
jgi:hypothetical protein